MHLHVMRPGLPLRQLQQTLNASAAIRRRYKTFTYDAPAPQGSTAPSPQQQLPGTISLRCSQNLVAANTGVHEWSAGLRLAELCLSQPELFAGDALHCCEKGLCHCDAAPQKPACSASFLLCACGRST